MLLSLDERGRGEERNFVLEREKLFFVLVQDHKTEDASTLVSEVCADAEWQFLQEQV